MEAPNTTEVELVYHYYTVGPISTFRVLKKLVLAIVRLNCIGVLQKLAGLIVSFISIVCRQKLTAVIVRTKFSDGTYKLVSVIFRIPGTNCITFGRKLDSLSQVEELIK